MRLGPEEVCAKTGTAYFPVALVLHSGLLRVIYFENDDVQADQYCKILKLQGFNTPLDQYSVTFADSKTLLQKGTVTSVLKARHKTSGKQVVVKLVDKECSDE